MGSGAAEHKHAPKYGIWAFEWEGLTEGVISPSPNLSLKITNKNLEDLKIFDNQDMNSEIPKSMPECKKLQKL